MFEGPVRVTLPPSQKLNADPALIIAVGFTFFVTVWAALKLLHPSAFVT